MTKKKLIYGALSVMLVVATILFTARLINAKPQPQKDETKHNIMYVKAQKVDMVETETNMVNRGRITAFDMVSLSSEVQGILMQGDVRFKEGEDFAKGDVLLKIYSEDVEASLKSGKSSFLQTLSIILPDMRVDYPSEYEKWITFFNTLDVEKALPQLPPVNSNQEKVFLAANNVLASYYSLRQQEINLKRYTIRAPFNGSFTAVNKEIGAVASPGVELASLIRLDKLEVTVPVFPADLKWIKKGSQVQIKDSEGKIQTVTVARISDYVDEATQSVNVFLTFKPDTKNSFLVGTYVDVTFATGAITGFEIPREALLNETFVYQLANKQLQKVEVEVLRQLEDSYIIGGFDSEMLVVTESLASVNPNAEYLAR